jgi:hypothetical protein
MQCLCGIALLRIQASGDAFSGCLFKCLLKRYLSYPLSFIEPAIQGGCIAFLRNESMFLLFLTGLLASFRSWHSRCLSWFRSYDDKGPQTVNPTFAIRPLKSQKC